jgi:hypothetical protein
MLSRLGRNPLAQLRTTSGLDRHREQPAIHDDLETAHAVSPIHR